MLDKRPEFSALYEEWRFLLTPEEISDEELKRKINSLLVEKDLSLPMVSRDELRAMVKKKFKMVCNPRSEEHIRGDVEMIIEHQSGNREVFEMKNTILNTGKAALANVLTNNIEDPFSFYIDTIAFGTGGTTGDGTTPRYVDASRTGLFSPLLTKGVISSINPSIPATAVFTSVLAYGDVPGSSINEMALFLASGGIYSMITFPNLNKTSSLQVIFNWTVSLL